MSVLKAGRNVYDGVPEGLKMFLSLPTPSSRFTGLRSPRPIVLFGFPVSHTFDRPINPYLSITLPDIPVSSPFRSL